ncbi:ABC-F family ATP-binding cassette domain-containing protein [Sphingobacterium sp. SYP-B4668]|uniref:ABC-F family ATP-binding cassette domain-containing protein n=1 Tax=Sphingobacterium sp. SYP-B4668 TaxID=2996035 RepID=UPI0022DCEA79|nr:ABC-F family ATP-binding cassette domain-containing protein [Sphingobacterium sp. SYP-B4668]
MSILSTEQVSHSFNDRWLFKDLHFGLQKGDRIALVGINGTGKSTLLSILAEKQAPTSGKVVKEKGIKVGFLPQNPDFSGLNSINDFIYSADNEQQSLIRAYEELLSQDNPDQQELEDLTEKLSLLEAWEYEYNIKTILNRLNITDFSQQIEKLSGGQRKRLSLAKLLIDEPDVYILDEPTNHLDIETIEWLEKLLTTGNKTVLLVTHDRYFLDGVCTEIRELDRGSLLTFKGNYSYYLEKKAERETNDALLVEKSRNLLRKELEWMRRQPQARGTKSKSRIEAYYDLEEKSKAAKKNESVQLSVKISRQGSKILELENVSKSFGSKKVIENFSYTFKKGDRIGLSGKNGSGKSTFLNLITNLETPTSGTVSIGETTVYGYYKQGGLEFQPNERVIDVVKNVAEYIEMAKGEVITASQLLTHFLFPPEKQFGLVEKLSGGERKRLQLMRVLMRNPNFLILDEPSNDLDIDTLNVLEDFLDKYTGVLLLVSHDRYLVDKMTDQLFIFDGTGSINIYNGNYADFKIEQEAAAKASKNTKEIDKPITKETVADKKKLSYKEEIEYKKLEEDITRLEEDIQNKNNKLLELTDHITLSDTASEITKLQETLETKTNRWMQLAELMG